MKSDDRPRCAQCRKRFQPKPSARAAQKVCGPECRRLRDNSLARRRRALDLDAAREDERLRQHKHRSAVPDGSQPPLAPSATPSCHTPPFDANLVKLQRKMLEVWDDELALSRARLQRRFRSIRAASGPSSGFKAPSSQATLDPGDPSFARIS